MKQKILSLNDFLRKEFDPGPDDYRMVMDHAWRDIHHSKLQEWSSFGVITATHVGIAQLLNLFKSNPGSMSVVIVIAALIGIVFAVIGTGITHRHRKLVVTKMSWITMAQYKLGLMIDISHQFSDEVNDKGVILLDQPMIDNLRLYENEVNRSTRPGKDRYKLVRRRSTSSLMFAYYLLLILLDGILVSYFGYYALTH
jgi:hypothetical protein